MKLAIAVDIETCPLPRDTLKAAQMKRLDKDAAYYARKDSESTQAELERLAQSMSPLLGWICCISAVCACVPDSTQDTSRARKAIRGNGEPNPEANLRITLGSPSSLVGTPRSWTASALTEESTMLQEFWRDMAKAVHNWRSRDRPRRVVWVTFNGKKFDAPFIEARSAVCGVEVHDLGLLDTYPYRQVPHADLLREWPFHYSLDSLCAVLGIESPKTKLDGSEVAPMVEAGSIEEVTRYCESDTCATMRCYLYLHRVLKGL